jgi:hypothetical protein
MRSIALVLILALGLWGCGGNVKTTPVALTQSPAFAVTGSPTNIFTFGGDATSTLLGSASVEPLLSFSELTTIGTTDLAFWGTKDTSGSIANVTEAEVYGLQSSPSFVHLFFNANNLPALARDDTSGYSLTIAYPTATSLQVTLCDPSGTALGNATSTIGDTAAVTGVSAGGSCAIALVNAGTASPRGSSAGASVPTNLASIAGLSPVLGSAAYANAIRAALPPIIALEQGKDPSIWALLGKLFTVIAIAVGIIAAAFTGGIKPSTIYTGNAYPPAINGLSPIYDNPPS